MTLNIPSWNDTKAMIYVHEIQCVNMYMNAHLSSTPFMGRQEGIGVYAHASMVYVCILSTHIYLY